jgi:hypothetical protein
MATDALLAVQASTTSTATAHSSALTLATGTPRRGLKARFLYSAASNASGSNTVIFSIDVSHDGGSNFYTEAESDPITLSTTVQSGELYVPFEISPTSVANGTQIKASITITGSGTSPTVTWQCDLTLGRP